MHLFPHETVRPVQNELMDSVTEAISSRKGLVVHAPTGLGKTAASLAPALRYAIDNDLTVFFLTSRHTQHRIAIETLRRIRERYSLDFTVADIIGKKHMCAQPGVGKLQGGEFYEYCKALREEGNCQFYAQARTGARLTTEGKLAMAQLEQRGPLHVEESVAHCTEQELCPYEIVSALSSKARVIVTDYYSIFHPTIRGSFFRRSGKSLDKAVVIADEGHNLPQRLRELLSTRLSTMMLRRGVKEARKHGCRDVIPLLTALQDSLNSLSDRMKSGQERLVTRDDVAKALGNEQEYEDAIAALELAAEQVVARQMRSALTGVHAFLVAWKGPDEGFARILQVNEMQGLPLASLTHRCLDPSVLSSDVVKQAHALIVMSGTLTPVEMYRDLLSMPNAVLKTYPSPFPVTNRLAVVLTSATTQYKARGEEQFGRIAAACSAIAEKVPGNVALFFPSYGLRDLVKTQFERSCSRTLFLEYSQMAQEEKAAMLERFAGYKKSGAVLMAVSSGSFSEGVDFPDGMLKGVVIVGLPLQRPDLETECLIKHYDRKFGRGWDYGYVYPAMNRAMQSAGRCIRSEKDRGAVVFLDMRYAWPQYAQCLPKEWQIRLARSDEQCVSLLEEFFG